jgi:hypothetical protein
MAIAAIMPKGIACSFDPSVDGSFITEPEGEKLEVVLETRRMAPGLNGCGRRGSS